MRPRLAFAALALAVMAYVMQQTMVVPALPALEADLHTTTTWVTWLVTVFMLVSVVATPLAGKLGDLYGKDTMLQICLTCFFLGAVAAIFAWDIWSLIVCRAVMGVGGAVFPLSFAIIKDEFPPEKVQGAIGMLASLVVGGSGVGFVLSGVIIDYGSWRLLFLAGAIAVGIGVVLVRLFVPESPIKTRQRLDFPGAILLSGALLAFLLALTEGESWGWSSARTLGLLGGSVALGLAWAAVEFRVEEPLLDMRMLGNRTVLLANTVSLFGGFATFGPYVLVPKFVETPRGLSAGAASLVHYGFGADNLHAAFFLLPNAITGLLAGLLSGRLSARYGPRAMMLVGLLGSTVTVTWLALFHDRSWQIVFGMAFMGLVFPFAFAAIAKLIVDAVRPHETGVAAGMNQVVRTIGSVISAQLGAAILTARTIGATGVPTESAYTIAWAVGAGVAALAAVVSVFVVPRRRSLAGAGPTRYGPPSRVSEQGSGR